MRVIGLASGSSMHGIDVAVARLRLAGATVELDPMGHRKITYPAALRDALLAALAPGPCTAGELCRLDIEVSEAFAEAATGIDADLVAMLGVPIHRQVDAGTLRLGQPGPVAKRTGLPAIAGPDPSLDRLWLSGVDEPTATLNLGGIAAVTVTGEPPVSFDAGPANVLLDVGARMVSDEVWQRDVDGELASQGSVRPDLLEALLADVYYVRPAPKSVGSGHFHAGYLRTVLERVPHVPAVDLLATLVELTAVTVAGGCRAHGVARVVVSGGGVHNPALMAALCRALDPVPLVTSDALGLPANAKDAYLVALGGFLTWHGAAQRPGGLTKGRGPLRLPEPATVEVTGLRMPVGSPTA